MGYNLLTDFLELLCGRDPALVSGSSYYLTKELSHKMLSKKYFLQMRCISVILYLPKVKYQDQLCCFGKGI